VQRQQLRLAQNKTVLTGFEKAAELRLSSFFYALSLSLIFPNVCTAAAWPLIAPHHKYKSRRDCNWVCAKTLAAPRKHGHDLRFSQKNR